MTNQQTSTNTFGVSKWIVSADATQGTHTTWTAATASASSGDTIWGRDGTYTENFSAKAGVTYTCGAGDGNSGNVVIVGNITCTGTGTFTFSNLRLQTNSANCLTVSGSSVTVVQLNNVYVNCTNNTGVSYTTSNVSSAIVFYNSTFNLGTTGIAYYSVTSTGALFFYRSDFQNSGGSTTASNNSANVVQFFSCQINAPLSTSSTGSVALYNSVIGTSNTACITTAGTGALNSVQNSWLSSGTASAISVGTGTTFYIVQSQIVSGNTNAITGAGSIFYAGLTFQGTSSTINVTTQTVSSEGPSKTIGSSNSGGTNTLTVTNSSNTASSNANILSTVGGASANDPTYQSVVSGATTWTWGIDNSDTDAWVLAASSALGTTNVIHAATGGQINYPLQPAFLAYVATLITNVTGDGTQYTIIYDTEVFDQGNNFTLATSIFTAPVTGRYKIDATVRTQGQTAVTAATGQIVTSNRTYRGLPAFAATGTNSCPITMSVLADMDTSDTFTITIQTTDTGGKVDDISGDGGTGNPFNWVSAFLAC